MFVLNGKRINIWAPYTTADGVQYGNLTDQFVRLSLGVQELPEPAPPEDYSEETYYRVESEEAPYVTYTRRSDEQIAQARASRIKAQIDAVEAQAMLPRAARDILLKLATGMDDPAVRRIREVEAAVAELRSQIPPLP